MIDREKVIRGLEVCIPLDEGETCPTDCPYYRDVCSGYSQVMRDALDLLKEQEEPRLVDITYQNKKCKDGNCPSCGQPLTTTLYPKFCGFCGQAVKWE